MPTIREIADACGVAKPTVKRRLQELGLWEDHVNKAGSSFSVDDFAASSVAASFSGEPQRVPADASGKEPAPGVVSSLDRYIESLERQLEAKDRQIAALSDRNGELSSRLDSMAARISELSEQVGRAAVAADRPHGLWDRLLGPGR